MFNVIKMSILNDFYNENIDKIKLVLSGVAHSKHKDFYSLIYSKKWLNDRILEQELIQYLDENNKSINKSLSLLGIKHAEIKHQAEMKLKKSKPFLKTISTRVNDKTELSNEIDNVYPVEFIRPESNEYPKLHNGRDDLIDSNQPITVYINKELINEMPSTARNANKYINLGLRNYPYYEYFKPSFKPSLYKKSQAKKFVGPRGTWMFDLMYFSDYNTKKYRKQAIYLVGININTRYAVIRRVNGKSVSDLIPAFESLLNNELKNKISMIIFDGEKAISSRRFEQYCKEHNINVRITYPGIHTQTAPIDRLCRTLRDYFTKFYMSKQANINRTYKLYNKWKQRDNYDKVIEESIKIRKMFNGEDKFKLAPIPMKYNIYQRKSDGEYLSKIEDDVNDILYTFVGTGGDELYNIVNYYNNKSHNGLIRLLKEASFTFKKPINYSDEKITPRLVHKTPYLEAMIIQYCRYYNNEKIEEGPVYNIGDKVHVYDCFTSERGALNRNNTELLIGNWEIVSKDGDIYGVFNNDNNQLLHVSKYMLKNRT